ncbi:2-amino-4-hydroxy-6-hydroxymethyldihydropteridine diphosphokinase [Crenothrix polyspora]|uniref:2-amino-4-hydroxy-6-hydroxymethyldihydropteridine diphosphokinase n=1 Tax=Crenothrix polyspora TaxID=360316 RepID=A0A1R4H4Z4_9GAMM|nr:2-amino-4-hydroxy-6-hydroxymethyldihydropteridine diphosphokinase [Crenothrix polyspora]SJM90900.1 2-amino-4-hydroxy-6-hydroxymethyldihydropteridinepyrophosphokinase [Crenothrix polyspora]
MAYGYISVGSNIDRQKYIRASLVALRHCFGQLVISSIYDAESVGFLGNSFYNCVVGFNTDLDVKDVAKQLRQIEMNNGRVRGCKKFSARTLDLDLLLYDNLIINEVGLQIPRNEIEKYAFVLEPLAEIAPTLKHPISQISYAALWEKFDKTSVKQQRINFL